MNEIWADKVLDEPHKVPAREARGHHQWGGKPHKAPAKGEVQTMALIQGQKHINR